jgi:Ran GTPase-activating protein (RanGAP) involved in mRNA processing and transport
MTDVNIANNSINAEGAQAIACALKDNVTLTRLNISGNHLGHAAGTEMGTVLNTHNTTLLHLLVGGTFKSGCFGPFLGNCAHLKINHFRDDLHEDLNFDTTLLHAAGAVIVASLLCRSKRCTVLRMNGNYLNSFVGPSLGSVLLNCNLVELYISDNVFHVDGSAALSNSLKHNSTLTLLHLKRNMIRALGAKHMGSMLSQNSTLLELDLSCNEISSFSKANDGVAPFIASPEGADALARGLSKNVTLTRLNVISNGIAVAGGTLLFSAISSTPSFVTLDVLPVLMMRENAIQTLSLKGSYGSRLEDGGTAVLAKLLATNTSVTDVDLSFNDIGPLGLAALSDGLQSNQSLGSLNLNNNNFGTDEGKCLAQFVLDNTTVSKLLLNGNKLRAKGAQAIAAALKKDTVLVELHLNNNALGIEGGAAIEAALMLNEMITHLHVWDNQIRHDVLQAIMNQKPVFAEFGGATALDLSDVRFDNDGADASVFCELLHTNRSLMVLNESTKERLKKGAHASGANRVRKKA